MKDPMDMVSCITKKPKRRIPISSPPGPRIPCDVFYSELSYAGKDNTIYIKIQTEPYLVRRKIMLAKLQDEYSLNPHPPIPIDEITPNMYVVIQCHDVLGYIFYRAKVIRVDDAQIVHCFLIDEGSEVMVLPTIVYRITQELLEAEVSVLKCYLDGLGFFDGLGDVQMAYQLIRMSDLSPEPFYPSKIVRNYKGTPVIRILWKDNLTLTSAVQQWILHFCSIPEPKIGDEIEGTVVHVDNSAQVWLQPTTKIDLINRIQDMLQSFDYSKVPKAFGFDPSEYGRYNTPRSLESMDHWKRKFFQVPTGVFITRYTKDGGYYRCTLLRSINKERVEVEFLDFGNSEIVPREGIINCKDVDENLGYIPPMCIKTRLYGFDTINEKYFCSQINEIIFLKVIIEGDEGEDISPAVEVYNLDSKISVNQEILISSSSTEFDIGYYERRNNESKRHHHYDYLM